jgi:hypothetical protein
VPVKVAVVVEEGLGCAAGGVVAAAAGGVAEDGVGEGDFLEFGVRGGFGGLGDFVW